MLRPNRTSVTVWIAATALITGLSYVLTGAAVPTASAQSRASAALVEFTADGKLKRRTVDYRKWVSVSTPLLLNDGDAEFHAVYRDPESFAHHEKTGKFRDGTVMLKEPVSVGSKEASSGKGYQRTTTFFPLASLDSMTQCASRRWHPSCRFGKILAKSERG